MRHSDLDWSNERRSSRAGRRDAEAATRALEILGPEYPADYREVAEARIADPDAPLSQIAAALGLTKDQAAYRFRRVLRHAARREFP